MGMPKEIFLHLHNDPDEEFPWTWAEDDFHEDSTRYVPVPEGSVVLTRNDLRRELRSVSGRNYCDLCQEYDLNCGCGMVDKARHVNNRRAEEAFARLTSESGTKP